MVENLNIDEIVLREQITSRGGGIEIDLTSLGFEGEKMAAYQNYLGGGLLGRVCVNDTVRQKGKPFPTEDQAKELDEIGEILKRHLFTLTNPDDEFNQQSYEQNQKMPISAY